MSVYSPLHTRMAVPAPGVRGGLTIARQEGDGIVRVIGEGSWTPQNVDDHFERLGRVVATMRAGGEAIRVLVDLRGADVQSPEASARVTAGTTAIYRSGDRVAIVMASSLGKLQMRRTIQGLEHEMFLSPGAAMIWLCACAQDRARQRA